MVMKRIIEALSDAPKIKYEGADRIPGTDKVRTYCSNASLYSKESDLENMLSNRHCTAGSKREH